MHADTYVADDLPPIVQRALSRLAHPDYFVELTPVERFALSQLVRRVDATLTSEIVWCKRSNFAKLLAVSEATVYRLLSKLESQGLILREEQTRSYSGALSVAAIRFTEKALSLLGFNLKQSETLYSKSNPSGRLAVVQDPNQELNNQFATRKQSGESFAKVPEDLRELHAARKLSTPQIFMLMGLATKASTRLSDIWSVIKGKVAQNLTSHALFAYLRKLITTTKDWSFIAKQASTEQVEQQTQERQKRALELLYASQAGRRFDWGDIAIEVCTTGTGFLNCRDSTRSWSAPPASEMAAAFWKQLLEQQLSHKD
ncbi:MAG: hypothetical protein ABL985_06365 [Casimicrobium sp.]